MIPIIPDIFEEIVLSVATRYGSNVYFEFGHPIELNNVIKQKDEVRQLQYPAVFLFTDINENRNIQGRWATINPTLVIVNETEQTYLASQRLENSFKPILYPIYELLIQEIENSSYFSGTFLNHGKRDHYFYGSDMNEGKSAFDQKFDAIEVTIKDLLVLLKC